MLFIRLALPCWPLDDNNNNKLTLLGIALSFSFHFTSALFSHSFAFFYATCSPEHRLFWLCFEPERRFLLVAASLQSFDDGAAIIVGVVFVAALVVDKTRAQPTKCKLT